MRKFSTKRAEEQVEIDGERYVVVQASGQAGSTYRSAAMQSMQAVDDGTGKPTIKFRSDADTGEALLVSLCLFKLAADGARAPVTREQVAGWSDDVQRALFEMVKAMSPSLDETPTRKSLDDQIERLVRLRDRLPGDGAVADAKK